MVLFKNFNKFFQTPITHFCINAISNELVPNYFKQREWLLTKLLTNHGFSDKQQANLKKFIIENGIQLTDQDLFKIDNSVKFWNKYVEYKPILTKEGNELIDHLYVLSTLEPRLMFIELNEMKKRVALVNNSGFVDCKQDVTRLFLKAPTAVFLQNWSDVICKAYYIHHRIIFHIMDKKPISLYPHPIVKYPIVLQLSFEDIKTRFLFAINSGLRAKGLFQNLNKETPYDVFRNLLATDFNIYLDSVCKGLTVEEYDVYKEMLKFHQREEDEIFRNLSELNNSISSDYSNISMYKN